MKSKNVMPTTYLLIAIIAMVAIHFLFPLVIIIPSGWNFAGLIPLALGVIVNLMADKAFHLASTTVKPFQPSSTLITDGVFRFSRNPMYLGFVLLLLGIAVLLRSLTPYLIVLAFAVLLDRMYIKVEERMLAETFGTVWEDYKKSTRRWV